MTAATMAGRVAAHPFAAGLSTAEQATLAGYGTAAAFAPGEWIFTENAVADRFWLLERGSVALDMRLPGRGDQIVETLRGPTVLGWSWLCPPYRWHFGAIVRDPVTAIAVDAGSVRRQCETDPSFGYAILRNFVPVIVSRLQATRLRVLDLYGPPAGTPR